MLTQFFAFFWPVLCCFSKEPISIFLSFLPLILARDMGASSFDLSILSASKALAPFLGFLFSFFLTRKVNPGPGILLIISFFARIPIFVLPFVVASSSAIIIATFCYVLVLRSIHPYWIDLIRLLYKEHRVECFIYLQRIIYILSLLLGPLFGLVLDRKWMSGTQLLFILAFWSLLSVIIQFFLGRQVKRESPSEVSALSAKETLWLLFHDRPLLRFHMIYFFVGMATNILNVWLPSFLAPLKETLPYTKLLSIMVCGKWLGARLILFFIKNWVKKDVFLSLRRIIVIALCQLFVVYIIMSGSSDNLVRWLIIYFGSGMVFAGGNLIWESSATLFCNEGDSRAYTQINLFMLGLRGIAVPLLIRILLQFGDQILWMCVITSFYVIGLFFSMPFGTLQRRKGFVE